MDGTDGELLDEKEDVLLGTFVGPFVRKFQGTLEGEIEGFRVGFIVGTDVGARDWCHIVICMIYQTMFHNIKQHDIIATTRVVFIIRQNTCTIKCDITKSTCTIDCSIASNFEFTH